MKLKGNRKGQAIVLVTLALFSMTGMMGLATDMGWSFYLEKVGQTAADSSAMAAVLEAIAIGGKDGPYNPGDSRFNSAGGFVMILPNSTSSYRCPPVNKSPTDQNLTNVDIACMYASKNGFSTANPRQNILIDWGNTSPPPGVPGMSVNYWTQVRVAQRSPQLFSALLGNTEGLVSSRATAAVVDATITRSLILLNRENDTLPLSGGGQPDTGINLLVNGNTNCPPGQSCEVDPEGEFTVRARGGMSAASQAHGLSGTQDPAAMEAKGGAIMRAQYYHIRGTGWYKEDNNSDFLPDPPGPMNGLFGDEFDDPTEGLANPPLPDPLSGNFQAHDVPGGSIAGGSSESQPRKLYPGVYVATVSSGGTISLTGDQIQLHSGYYQFVDSAGNPSNSLQDYVFIGGLSVQGANVKLGAGRYVMGATKPKNNTPGVVFDMGSNMILDDQLTPDVAAPNNPPHAGELFVLAGPNYVGSNNVTLDDVIMGAATQVGALAQTAQQLGLSFGKTLLQTGTGGYINIHALNPDRGVSLNSSMSKDPDELDNYRRLVIWQDRDNSVVDYNFDGTINSSCGSIDSPCTTGVNGSATNVHIQASPSAHFYGVMYQPRGAFTSMGGGGKYVGPLQVVTGAFVVQGGAKVDMLDHPHPITKRIVALVQ